MKQLWTDLRDIHVIYSMIGIELCKVEKLPVTFNFIKKSSYWPESLLEGIKQNIAGSTNLLYSKICWLKSFLTMPNNVLPLHLKQTFPHIIWIFTEGDGIKSRLPFKQFPTLSVKKTGGMCPTHFHCVKVRQNRNDFFKPTFPPKTRKKEFNFTIMRLVFVRFLEEIEDTKMTLRN